MNHLEGEKSRYLKQHVDNPVDWYPWCEEAFEKAKSEDKPIFLSIGYSSCHWCHVMAHESFEDEELSEMMNQTFVSIKVDKEERPDVDKVYMEIARAITGSGGWPLSIVMTPDKKPFYAATYIPKESRDNQMGMKDLTRRIDDLWSSERDKVIRTSDKIISMLREKEIKSNGKIDKGTLDDGYDIFKRSFDKKYYGFGRAPKFPSPHNLLFLLRYWKITGEHKALDMVEKTLEAMRLGGIYDHIGFGFHRYSTDRRWMLPHFEKMLYDQAMLILAYSEAYRSTDKKKYKKTAEETIEYVLRDLKSDSGGFYSSQDADVGGIEGGYYIWSEEEIDRILGDKATRFKKLYNVKSEGNYLEESTGERTGRNVLYLDEDIDENAEKEIEEMRRKLYEERKKREMPGKDKKILTDWNSLTIVSLLRASNTFDNDIYLDEADKGLDFILNNMISGDKLYHRYIEGEIGIDGMLDDYALFIWSLIEMYRITEDEQIRERAIELLKVMIEKFWDDKKGGFYFSSTDELPLKEKEVYDGAYPSGNSIALLDLIHLYSLTHDTDYKEMIEMMLDCFSGPINTYPSQYTMFLNAYESYIED